MPRQGRSGGARSGSRPSVTPARPAPVKQSRSTTTTAYPPAAAKPSPPPAPPAAPGQSQGQGVLGNIVSTAAGVAIGSSIFHGVGSLFGGGSSAATEQQQNSVAAQGQDQVQAQNSWGARGCEVDARQLTKCLDEHQGNMQICGWYLDQLKACQSAASKY